MCFEICSFFNYSDLVRFWEIPRLLFVYGSFHICLFFVILGLIGFFLNRLYLYDITVMFFFQSLNE